MASNTKSKSKYNDKIENYTITQNQVVIQPNFNKLRLDRLYFFDTINYQKKYFFAYLKNVSKTTFRCGFLDFIKGDLCMIQDWIVSVKSLDEITYHKLPLPTEIIDYISTF